MNTHSGKGDRLKRTSPRPADDPQRRATILRAAQTCFAQAGFHRTTMRAVARQAGLAEGTLYHHFGSKDDLLLGLFGALGAQARDSLDPAALAALNLRDFLRAFLAAPLTALAQDEAGLLRVILSEGLIRRDLGRAFAEGLTRTADLGAQALAARPELRGVDTGELLRTGLALVLGHTVQGALSGDPLPDPQVTAARVADGLLALLAAERA
ncbi:MULTISPECIES: TetR/AcrR family transcriptional regulator [Deinococcus]|uniref:TetR/AcrR family transcriptional regulator n=1 Tax=Deinococcus rufus TaxID=2136097 RepID=A0ABV7ZE55_9DEIO|nr:helix-turn-helix domain-containing protein [Deinococcus sp. AB2017081]WQE94247.1 helix-turn-helix domain-containing protein [Deinococcus sp. AB2017081]